MEGRIKQDHSLILNFQVVRQSLRAIAELSKELLHFVRRNLDYVVVGVCLADGCYDELSKLSENVLTRLWSL